MVEKDMIPYSIIVVCYNLWRELTLPFLQTFWEYIDRDIEFEFWFVDNGSMDETIEQSQIIIPELKTLNCVGVNWYFWNSEGQDGVMPKVRNYVYSRCKGERIILMNNDILFRKGGWLKILDEAMGTPCHKGKEVGMAGQDWMSEDCISFIGGGWDCIPKKVHDEIVAYRGYFSDPKFGLTCDDVDLSGMAQKLGYGIKRVAELKDAYIHHLCHKTMDAFISIVEQTHRAAADRALIEKRCEEGYYN